MFLFKKIKFFLNTFSYKFKKIYFKNIKIVTFFVYIIIFLLSFLLIYNNLNFFYLWILIIFIITMLKSIFLTSYISTYKWIKTRSFVIDFLIYVFVLSILVVLELIFSKFEILFSNVHIILNESIQTANSSIKLWISIYFSLTCILLIFYLRFTLSNMFELIILLGFTLFIILFVYGTDDIFNIFIGFEIITIIIIASAGISVTVKSGEVAIKYFSINVITAGFALVGISILYVMFKITSVHVIGSLLVLVKEIIKTKYSITKMVFNCGVFLWLLSFLFKLGIFPLNSYVPDFYEGTSKPVVFFLSSIIKPIIFFIFLKIFYVILVTDNEALFIFSLLFIVNIFVGDFLSAKIDSIKRSLGHISIGQYGFLCIAVSPKNKNIAVFLFLYLFIYNILLFWVFFLLMNYRNHKHEQVSIRYFNQISNKNFFNPVVKYGLTFSFGLMSGLPPSILFFYKYFIFLNISLTENYLLLFLILIINLASYFYYFRVLIDIWNNSNITVQKNILKNTTFLIYTQQFVFYLYLFMLCSFFISFFSLLNIELLYIILDVSFFSLTVF